MAEITMPRLSDTMEEGTLSRWLVKPGDEVHRGDVIAEIETDKATMDLEAYDSGVLEKILLNEGETAPIGATIAVLGSGSSSGAGTAQEAAAGTAPSESAGTGSVAPAPKSTSAKPASGSSNGSRPIPSSPLARSLAREHGIDITTLSGSGPGGRVVRADVEDAIARLGAAPSTPLSQVSPGQPARTPQAEGAPSSPVMSTQAQGGLASVEVPLSSVRRVTAQRLAQATTVPHFELTRLVDAERLVSLRAELNESLEGQGDKVSLNDMVIKACAKALLARPELNSSWVDGKLLRHNRINIGIAVAVPEGLVVPVVKDAASMGVVEISRETRRLSEKARGRGLELADLSDATFTISNLGPYGIDQFTAVINPPQAAILAVGSAEARPVVRNGEIVARVSMYLTLSVDHRVQDGAGAAEFLQELAAILEAPLRILA